MDGARQRSTRLLILGLIFVVAVLAAFLYTAGRGVADPDQFWHVATGKWVVEHRQVPTTDPFSWYASAKHHHWVAQEWLFGTFAYAVHELAGWKGLYLFVALLDGLLVMLIYALSRARGTSPMWSFLIMVASLSGLLWFAVPRPHMVTWCLVVLTALLLEKGKWPWALLCVLVGVNMHGAVWPLYIILFAYYEFPKRWWLIPLATAVTLVNPNPVGVFLYPFQAFISPVAAQINEFQPTALWEKKLDLAMYLGLLVAVHRKRVNWRDALLAIALVLLSLSAIRHVQWFYVLVLPIMAPYIVVDRLDFARMRNALARLPLPGRIRDALSAAPAEGTGETAEPPAAPESEDAAPAASAASRLARSRVPEILLIGALTIFAVYLGGRAYRQRVDVERYYPREMVPYLKLHGIKRFFNVWHEGGYLIYKGMPPMIDGRGDPYNAQKPGGLDMAGDYMALIRNELPMREYLVRYDIEYLVLPGGGLLNVIMYDPAFTWVKTTPTHALLRFDKKKAEDQANSLISTETVVPVPSGSKDATSPAGATNAP